MAEDNTPQPMSQEDLQTEMARILEDTIAWTDTELSVERAKAASYYQGEPFGNEEEGRSQVVMTEVRDGILGVLPSAMRVIFGPEHTVEYLPRRADSIEAAKQATDYVRYVFEEDNSGFLITHAVWKDALLKKVGIYKWGWAPDKTRAYSLEGVTETQLLMLQQDEDVEITRVTPTAPSSDASSDASSAAAPAAPGTPAAPPEPTYDVEVTKTIRAGRPFVEGVPPEEFLVTRQARTIDDALLVAHRSEKTREELIEMGIDPKDIDEHGSGPDLELESNPEEIERRSLVATGYQEDPSQRPGNNRILYVEAYPLVDFDGDGKRELRRVCMIGRGFYIVENEPVDERPFAYFTPDPEPHAFFGNSYADRLMDMQLLKSNLVRSVLDSLAASIFPRTGYVEGEVNVEDILNTAMGAPIRMTQPNMLQPITHTFVGADALPLFTLIDDTIERRTGRNKGVIGLDADALQSTTQSAVGAAITAAQEQSELLVRVFAEMTLKPLFRGLYRLIVARQMKSRIVRLRGQFVEVDPRPWDADMDVVVNVALGSGTVEKKIAVLEGIIAKQELIISTLGPNNPIATLAQYSNALTDVTLLAGQKNPGRYFTQLPPNFQMPPSPPQPNPAQIQAQAQIQVEQIRSQTQSATHAREMALKEIQLRLDHERDMTKLATEATLKSNDIVAKHGVAMRGQNLDAQITHTKNVLDHASTMSAQDTDALREAHDMALAHGQAGAQHALAVSKLQHDQQMAERDREIAEQQAAQSQAASGTNE